MAGKASRPGAVDQGGHRRFLSVVASVVMLGTLTVGYVRADRQYEHPTVLDSWQNAYGVFDCETDTWLPPLDSRSNPQGIRSRGDGIIYIEPATEAVAGDNATLDRFVSATGVELSDDTLRMPDGTELREQGTFCDGEPALLQVLRWEHGSDSPSEVRFDGLAETAFLADLESLAIVLAPADATISTPPSTVDLPEPRAALVAGEY